MVMPAAPTPEITIFKSSIFFYASLSAFIIAAKVTIDVPC